MVKNDDVSLLVNERELGGAPSGIAFSTDEGYIYFNANFNIIMRHQVRRDGALTNGTVFVDWEGSDGIKVEQEGNVYTTSGAGPVEVRIMSRAGVRIGTIKLPILSCESRAQIGPTVADSGDRDCRGAPYGRL